MYSVVAGEPPLPMDMRCRDSGILRRVPVWIVAQHDQHPALVLGIVCALSAVTAYLLLARRRRSSRSIVAICTGLAVTRASAHIISMAFLVHSRLVISVYRDGFLSGWSIMDPPDLTEVAVNEALLAGPALLVLVCLSCGAFRTAAGNQDVATPETSS